MNTVTCPECQKNPARLTCGVCSSPICKSCAEVLAPEDFQYSKDLSEELIHGTYCPSCYGDKVAGPLASYFETLETAKNINIFFKNQGKETRLIPRKERPLHIEACDDREDVIMKLAFHAALSGFDSVIDIELKSEKVRNGSYQKLIWRGSGVPANSKGKIITTDKSIWDNPN